MIPRSLLTWAGRAVQWAAVRTQEGEMRDPVQLLLGFCLEREEITLV